MYALSLTSIYSLSPTFDEQGFITRGLGYLRGENQYMRVGHPLGLNALNAVLLVEDKTVHLPTSDPTWALTSFHRPSEIFLWEMGNDVAHVMFLARLPTIWLGMLLAALASRWAWELTHKRGAALLVLCLVAFDPNILAHTRLATTDLGLTAVALLAGYTLWRFWQKPSWPHAALAGIAFGLLQDTKFTAGLFIPLFALVIVMNLGLGNRHQLINRRWSIWFREHIRHLFMLIVAYALIAPLTLWAAYGFQIGTLPFDLPTLSQVGGYTVPLSHYLEQLLDIGGRMQKSTPSFLHGAYSDSGWWYYFPVAFLLKTPLPTLLLLAAAAILRGKQYLLQRDREPKREGISRRQMILHDAALLIPALGYFAFALTTDINLGYRHILPVLPFLYVFTAVSLAAYIPSHPSRVTYALAIPAAWLIGIALWIHPNYLAYFNLLTGGPDGGWRYLVDSNLDWGQDLGALKQWMDENGIEQVWLSYFGEGRPEYYGINYIGLDSWPPRLMNPYAQPFYPFNPAPGLYAISATNLQGVQFEDHNRLAWFRERTPIAKIGYSIFIYEVEPTGPPLDLALGGMQLDALTPADFAQLGTNQVIPHWFDPQQSLLLPSSDMRWLALSNDLPLAQAMTALLPLPEETVETAVYTLYHLPPPTQTTSAPLARFTNESGTLTLLRAIGLEKTKNTGESIQFITSWYKESLPQPLKIFAHLVDETGNIVAQWDGLGATWQGWRTGDTLWQWHEITVPAETLPDMYELRIGLYNPETNQRWLTEDGHDFIILDTVEIDD